MSPTPSNPPGAAPSINPFGGGCCSSDEASMSGRSRALRGGAGLGFLAIAGAMGSRRLPGGIALWPAAVVPTWFGVSHLVAGMTGYPGCPELSAIPSVMLGRPVGTACRLWEWIDQRAATGSRPWF